MIMRKKLTDSDVRVRGARMRKMLTGDCVERRKRSE